MKTYVSESIIEQSEQIIRDYFWVTKKHFGDVPVVFLSKRIQMVYEILLSKYPEIKFKKYYSNEDKIPLYEKLKCVYLNDISYELLAGMNPQRYVPRFNIETCKYSELATMFISEQQIGKITPPYLKTDISERKQKKINGTNNKQFRYCSVSDMVPVINLLEAERRLLEYNGIKNSVELLPIPFQEYFRFCLEYSEQLERFREKYKETYERRNGDITILEIRTIVGELVNEFGSAQVSSDLVKLILETDCNSVWLKHETIKNYDNEEKTVGHQKVK